MIHSISHIRDLLAKGTPGEWRVQEWRHWADPSKPNFVIQYTATDRWNFGATFALANVELFGSGPGDSGGNASLIATSHNSLPALLEIAEAAVRWRDAVSDAERGVAILALSNATFKVKP